MIKSINYFIQALIIYIFFFIGKIFGLKLSRIIFSSLFSLVGPIFKSKKVIKKNLEIFSSNISTLEKSNISKSMWENYGMTFIEYIFLNYFKSQNSHVDIIGEEILANIIK